ncbi:MAG TPA: hypothetical protein PKD64_03515 [Pirellulaceae bacterium]|nr:hypothetical protein [Pirellulaceae bacterium]HMO91239.1 hypothetical protein [Pirellulaceae bacterium]HMP68577.1 hypothetical protein [Pirellulaceae bacterium]
MNKRICRRRFHLSLIGRFTSVTEGSIQKAIKDPKLKHGQDDRQNKLECLEKSELYLYVRNPTENPVAIDMQKNADQIKIHDQQQARHAAYEHDIGQPRAFGFMLYFS